MAEDTAAEGIVQGTSRVVPAIALGYDSADIKWALTQRGLSFPLYNAGTGLPVEPQPSDTSRGEVKIGESYVDDPTVKVTPVTQSAVVKELDSSTLTFGMDPYNQVTSGNSTWVEEATGKEQICPPSQSSLFDLGQIAGPNSAPSDLTMSEKVGILTTLFGENVNEDHILKSSDRYVRAIAVSAHNRWPWAVLQERATKKIDAETTRLETLVGAKFEPTYSVDSQLTIAVDYQTGSSTTYRQIRDEQSTNWGLEAPMPFKIQGEGRTSYSINELLDAANTYVQSQNVSDRDDSTMTVPVTSDSGQDYSELTTIQMFPQAARARRFWEDSPRPTTTMGGNNLNTANGTYNQ
ncbi:hypothetical protein HOC01_03150 [archaeon]|jgi:hypothetical protein|nr:hypothetical protein [archaeon]MBT6698112.1 hypothetical protein [archaeon]